MSAKNTPCTCQCSCTLDPNNKIINKNTANKKLINFHENAPVTDITLHWIYEAHSVLLLGIVLFVLLYYAFTAQSESGLDLHLAMKLNIFLFLAVGCLVFPAGPFIRPHPIFWRLIFGMSLLYAFLLLTLLALSPSDARALLSMIFNDETLGKPQPERSYAVDCSFNFTVIYNVLDRFIIAHFLGWAVKALIVRDRVLLWAISILWELVELSTAYFIPNFAECWWDQLFLDVLICNGLGIEMGLYISQRWHPEPRREWIDSRMIRSIFSPRMICGKFQRLCIQFTPLSITPMHWEPMKSFQRYIWMNLVIVACLLIDLNAFLLKLYLHIPIEHDLNVWRIALILSFGVVSAKQFYLYTTNEQCKKLGSQTWLIILILVLELALSIKCAPSPFPEAPYINKFSWTVSLILWCVFTYVMFRSFRHVKIA